MYIPYHICVGGHIEKFTVIGIASAYVDRFVTAGQRHAKPLRKVLQGKHIKMLAVFQREKLRFVGFYIPRIQVVKILKAGELFTGAPVFNSRTAAVEQNGIPFAAYCKKCPRLRPRIEKAFPCAALCIP